MSHIPAPVLDHVVINVKDQLDDALAIYRKLGFALTGRGHHSLGSSNHLAIFGENYLELLGFEAGKTIQRPDIVEAPLGLTGLVFKTTDSLALYDAIRANGLAVEQPSEFGRPVTVAEGVKEARFRTVRLGAELVRNGRTFFCHHFTPELVWRDEWRAHPNGVTDIAGYVIASPSPANTVALYQTLFKHAKVTETAADGRAFQAGQARVEFVTPAEAERRFGPVATTADGSERSVALVLRTRSIAALLETFSKNGIPSATLVDGSVRVLANDAFGVALQFVSEAAA